MKVKYRSRTLLYIFTVLLSFLLYIRKQKLPAEILYPVPLNLEISEDAFDFMMRPETSKRDNFGVLFARSLEKAGKTQGKNQSCHRRQHHAYMGPLQQAPMLPGRHTQLLRQAP